MNKYNCKVEFLGFPLQVNLHVILSWRSWLIATASAACLWLAKHQAQVQISFFSVMLRQKLRSRPMACRVLWSSLNLYFDYMGNTCFLLKQGTACHRLHYIQSPSWLLSQTLLYTVVPEQTHKQEILNE